MLRLLHFVAAIAASSQLLVGWHPELNLDADRLPLNSICAACSATDMSLSECFAKECCSLSLSLIWP